MADHPTLVHASSPYQPQSAMSLPQMSVLSSKLAPPVLSKRTLTRPLLLARLAAWRTHRLTIISTPAGYGKTTLASQLLQQTESNEFRTAWLTLDAEDDAPTQFVTCIAAALAPLISAAASQVASLINQQLPHQALQQLLSALDTLSQPVLFMLDDLHRVCKPEVHQLLTYAVDRSPAHVHWLILTRHTATDLFSRLRLQDQLLEIEEKDLLLSPDELRALVTAATDMVLDKATLAVLYEQTQGWVTGVQLALLSLRRFAGDWPQRLDKHELYNHFQASNRLLAGYVTTEVLAQLDASLRTFLLKIAILERLHPALCDAVANTYNSKKLLEQAVAQQLFVRPLDARGEWYVMHQILRTLLVDLLHQTYSPQEVQALYCAASGWHLAQGDLSNALNYLVSGQATSLAGALLETHSRAALQQNRLAELRHWYNLLPAAQIDSRPQLLLDLGWLSFAENAIEVTTNVMRAEINLGDARPLPRQWQDELTVLRLLARIYNSDFQDLYADAEATLTRLAPSSHLARGWCLTLLTIIASNHAAAPVSQAQFESASAEFHAAGFNFAVVSLRAIQANQQMLNGEAQAALATCQTALESTSSQADRLVDSVCFFHGLMGATLYWLDQPQRAALHFQRALEAAPYGRDAHFLLLAPPCLQLCAVAQGEPVAATAQQRAEELALWRQFAPEFSLISRCNLVYWQMRRWLVLGDPASAWATFQRLEITLDTLAPDAPQLIWLTLLAAYIAAERELDALGPHLERVLQRSRQTGQLVYTIQAQTLLALQQQQIRHHDASRATLRQVLHDVERTGYVRFIFDQPTLLPKLKLIGTAFASKLAAQMTPRPLPVVVGKLTVRQNAILKLLLQGHKPAEIAAELVLTEGTVRWHMTNLYAMMGVQNQRQLIAQARLRSLSATTAHSLD